MNNFIFENATKVYFGKGCVKEYLSCLSKRHGVKAYENEENLRNGFDWCDGNGTDGRM